MVVVDRYRWVVEVAHERRPPLEAVVDGPRDGRSLGDAPSLFVKPGAQLQQDGSGPLLSSGQALRWQTSALQKLMWNLFNSTREVRRS